MLPTGKYGCNMMVVRCQACYHNWGGGYSHIVIYSNKILEVYRISLTGHNEPTCGNALINQKKP